MKMQMRVVVDAVIECKKSASKQSRQLQLTLDPPQYIVQC